MMTNDPATVLTPVTRHLQFIASFFDEDDDLSWLSLDEGEVVTDVVYDFTRDEGLDLKWHEYCGTAIVTRLVPANDGISLGTIADIWPSS